MNDSKFSTLVFGGSSLAGLYSSIDNDEVYETVNTAVQLGIRTFDTAPHYGCGVGEERLGVALNRSLHSNKIPNEVCYPYSKLLINTRY
jgi:aryl-alcohol dehydrogenase-like predicted oxidoreductase